MTFVLYKFTEYKRALLNFIQPLSQIYKKGDRALEENRNINFLKAMILKVGHGEPGETI